VILKLCVNPLLKRKVTQSTAQSFAKGDDAKKTLRYFAENFAKLCG